MTDFPDLYRLVFFFVIILNDNEEDTIYDQCNGNYYIVIKFPSMTSLNGSAITIVGIQATIILNQVPISLYHRTSPQK